MKKISTIIGVGMISMAVALAPAFAQMTKPQEPAGSTTAVQPKADDKAPLSTPAAKDDKTIPAKPGADVKSDTKAMPAKPGTDVKASTAPAVPAKPGADGKASTTPAVPAVPAKPGTDVKSDSKAMPAKPGTDVKAGAPAGKSDTGVKSDTAAPVKPGSAVKSDKSDKAVKSDAKPAVKKVGSVKSGKAHLKKVSSKTAKHHHLKTKDADKKAGVVEPVKPSTGN